MSCHRDRQRRGGCCSWERGTAHSRPRCGPQARAGSQSRTGPTPVCMVVSELAEMTLEDSGDAHTALTAALCFVALQQAELFPWMAQVLLRDCPGRVPARISLAFVHLIVSNPLCSFPVFFRSFLLFSFSFPIIFRQFSFSAPRDPHSIKTPDSRSVTVCSFPSSPPPHQTRTHTHRHTQTH